MEGTRTHPPSPPQLSRTLPWHPPHSPSSTCRKKNPREAKGQAGTELCSTKDRSKSKVSRITGSLLDAFVTNVDSWCQPTRQPLAWLVDSSPFSSTHPCQYPYFLLAMMKDSQALGLDHILQRTPPPPAILLMVEQQNKFLVCNSVVMDI